MSRAMVWTSRGVASLVMGLGIIGCLALSGGALAAEPTVTVVWPVAEEFHVSGTTIERTWCVDDGDRAEWVWSGQAIDGDRIERAAVNVTAWVSDQVLGRAGFDLDVAIFICHVDGTLAEVGILHLENPFEPHGAVMPEATPVGYLAQGAYVLSDPMLIAQGFRVCLEPIVSDEDTGLEGRHGTGAFSVINEDAVLAYLAVADDAEDAGPAVDLAAILADPKAYEGQGVRLDGEFYGTMTELVDGVRPDCTYDGCGYWVFGADGWYIYVVGQSPAGLDPALAEDFAKSVLVEGTVRVQLSRSAQPYAYLNLVSATPGEDAVDLRLVDVSSANGRAVMLTSGDTLAIDLPSNPTTGYRWELVSLEPEGIAAIVGAATGSYLPANTAPGLIGSGGIQRFVILGKDAGEALLQLAYMRASGAGEAPADAFSLTIHVAAPFVEAQTDDS